MSRPGLASRRDWRRLDAIADRWEAERERERNASRVVRARVYLRTDDLRPERVRWGEWLARGADLEAPHKLAWSVAGRCMAPKLIARTVRRNAKGRTYSMLADLHVACRACEACLRARARLWASRAKSETAVAARTWFVTLTWNPTARLRLLSEARAAARKASSDLEALPEAERFRMLAKCAGTALTNYLKRLRKGAVERGWEQVQVRYFSVFEAHKDGWPHVHMLVHELKSGSVVYDRIKETWGHGFVHAKLVQPDEGGKTAWYVAKYLAKAMLARVRASTRYGRV